MQFAHGFSKIVLITGLLVVLVSAISVSASARSALRHKNILRIRGGGLRNNEAAESFQDLANSKEKLSTPAMSFMEVDKIDAPHQLCNATKKTKGPYQYYF
jgi:hypothetical protein